MIVRDGGGKRGAGVFRPPAPVLASQRGMVLLEAALAIPLLLVVALAGLGTARVAVGEVATVAAARDAALQAARGASTADVRALVHQRLPGAEVTITVGGTSVSARVRASSPVLPGFSSAAVQHRATAVAATEPGLP